jgi:hypothetical protein
MGNLRLVRRLRIFFAVFFVIEYLLGNHTGASFAMCAYLITLAVGHDMMERVFMAAEEGGSEHENGTGPKVGRGDVSQADPGKKDELEGGPR